MTFTAILPDLGLSKGREGFFVDLGFESGLESLVGIVRTQEGGVADEEALFVVVGVNEPTGDALGAVAADFPGLRMEDIHSVDLDLDLASFL